MSKKREVDVSDTHLASLWGVAGGHPRGCLQSAKFQHHPSPGTLQGRGHRPQHWCQHWYSGTTRTIQNSITSAKSLPMIPNLGSINMFLMPRHTIQHCDVLCTLNSIPCEMLCYSWGFYHKWLIILNHKAISIQFQKWCLTFTLRIAATVSWDACLMSSPSTAKIWSPCIKRPSASAAPPRTMSEMNAPEPFLEREREYGRSYRQDRWKQECEKHKNIRLIYRFLFPSIRSLKICRNYHIFPFPYCLYLVLVRIPHTDMKGLNQSL